MEYQFDCVDGFPIYLYLAFFITVLSIFISCWLYIHDEFLWLALPIVARNSLHVVLPFAGLTKSLVLSQWSVHLLPFICAVYCCMLRLVHFSFCVGAPVLFLLLWISAVEMLSWCNGCSEHLLRLLRFWAHMMQFSKVQEGW